MLSRTTLEEHLERYRSCKLGALAPEQWTQSNSLMQAYNEGAFRAISDLLLEVNRIEALKLEHDRDFTKLNHLDWSCG